MEHLSGKDVVVTGGTGALGGVVVQRLEQAGARCHVPSRREGVDLADEQAVDRYYEALPPLWASIHVAGGFSMSPVDRESRAGFMHMMEVNALTVLLCSRAAVRNMRRKGSGGRIVNVCSRPGLEPRRGAGMVAYAASKAAVAAITLALAEELKDEQILVNAIAPSMIDTPANRKAMPRADFARWLSPEAAAEVILQLLLPGNTAVSGAVLPLFARA